MYLETAGLLAALAHANDDADDDKYSPLLVIASFAIACIVL